MNSVSFDKTFNNSKLFFSKDELSKILSCYSLGVSRGNWKDYAINFSKNEASFLMYKNTIGFPDCVLIKSLKNKKNKYIYKLHFNNIKKNNFTHIDELLVILKRKNLKIV